MTADGEVRRVVVATPDASVRLDVSAVLGALDDVEVVGEAGDVSDLAAVLDKHRPGMALVDLDLPGLEGSDGVAGALRDIVPGLKVIVVTDRTTDAAVVRTLRSGVDGFVVKDAGHEMLPVAIEAVLQDGIFVDPRVASALVSFALERSGQDGPSDRP